MLLQIFAPVDPSLGRVDYASLSDEVLMEMLYDCTDDSDPEGDQIDFSDICEWEVIVCEDDRVTHINLNGDEFTLRQFRFEFIPPLVVCFKAHCANLHGTLDASVLPRNLEIFKVHENALHGSVDLLSFPRKLKKIKIAVNKLEGSLQLSDLPPSLTHFDASQNEFIGEVCLNEIPPNMEELYVGGNKLTGSISIARLPASMTIIDLRGNAFSGEFQLLSFPEDLYDVNVTGNKIDKKFMLAKASGEMHFDIKADCIESVVDEAGERHEWQEQIFQEQKKPWWQRKNAKILSRY